MIKIKLFHILLAFFFTPVSFSKAINIPPPLMVSTNVVGVINMLFNLIWPPIVAAVVILFIMAGFSFLTAQGDPSKLESARRFALWGIVGIVAILLAFSIMFIISMGLENAPQPPIGQANGTLRIIKNTIDEDGTFAFNSNFGINSIIITTSNRSGSHDIPNLFPSTYFVSENIPAGWILESATCNNGTPQAIVVTAGDTTTCIFTNKKQ
jgi:hypothetical protein